MNSFRHMESVRIKRGPQEGKRGRVVSRVPGFCQVRVWWNNAVRLYWVRADDLEKA